MESYGLHTTGDYFLEGDFLKESGFQGGKTFLKMTNPPTAVFATNDHMALGAYEAILSEGVKIPEGVALVGFNDIEFSAIRGVELTTIGQKKYEMGTLAVKMLVERIEEGTVEPSREIILEPELIIRNTCGFRLKGYQIPGALGNIDGMSS